MSKNHHAPRAHNDAAAADNAQQEPVQGVFTHLIPQLQRAVSSEGYVTPTAIQEQAIPHLMEGSDLLGCAQTGTGKTAAFALPLLHQFANSSRRPQKGSPQALILAPTRELAAQIDNSIKTYGRYLRVKHTMVCGGVSQFPQVKALNRGVDIVVATPGRLLDLMEQGVMNLEEVNTFVLDEMDRMLDMGFIPDIKRIMARIPAERQTLFFSATINPKMANLAHTMVRDPVHVNIAPEEPTLDSIKQKVLFVDKGDKNALLISLLNEPHINKALVFTQMKHVANRVAEKLCAAGIDSTAIHGNKSQAARTKALEGFKRGRVRVLVATDVAARGLDVDDITHVINYDLPGEAENYVHRIGRTARAGAEGDAISFCAAEDGRYLRDIERVLGKPVPPDTEHDYHCEKAFKTAPSRTKIGGRNNSKPRYSSRPRRTKSGRPRNRRSR